jgi:hypothetical protein
MSSTGTSSTGVYFCCNDLRRNAVRGQTTLNGIDFLEVVDHAAPTDADRQRILRVHFVNTPAPAGLTRANVVIAGGERIRGITVDAVTYVGNWLEVHVTPRGDFSTYTLRLVEATPPHVPLQVLDRPLSEIEFSFKVECESDFDCRATAICPPRSEPGPEINYLSRDYASFRRLMLDRLSLLVPGWRERTPADLGVTLVELLAYVADHLSYRQDAIATEAYLGTARRRISVRRHARLVDYLLHDGCNARAFIHVHVIANNVVVPAGTQLLTRVPGPNVLLKAHEVDLAVAAGALVFETMHDATLQQDHNLLDFYTWQSTDCCLPLGATSATLIKHHDLPAGTLLLLGEIVGARTGVAADADRDRRHVVRLTDAGFQTTDQLTATKITEIRWDTADALPFPLCISTTITDELGKQVAIPAVSVAIGNILLADHGRSITETLEPVPKPVLSRPAQDSGDACSHPGDVDVLPRFRPRLGNGPLTQTGRTGPATAGVPVPPAIDGRAPATTAMHWAMAEVLPHIDLTLAGGDVWNVRRDLFESDSASEQFVAEVEEDGLATLRFGDDEYGRRPLQGTVFQARYRVGNGTEGNIGINAIAHIVSNDTGIDFLWNPIAASGGVDPETLEHARQSAPAAFRVQERAVTEADYAEVTERHREVSRAAATFRWTGSWYTLFDTIDRSGGAAVDGAFETEIRRHVETYRVVGNDLEIDPPQFVSLELALTICVKGGYFRSDVAAELRDVLSSGTRRDGRPGFFHPDNFTFAQAVPLSAIVAAAASVDGVDGVFVDAFRRQGSPATDARDSGALELGRLEIARLENSRNFPEHGSLSLTMRGGA